MIYIKRKQNLNFSDKKIQMQKGYNSHPAFGASVGAAAGLIGGGGLGLSSAVGHAVSGMTDVGYKNDLTGGVVSTVIPAAGGFLVGGPLGAAFHGAAGLGGYIYGKNKRDKSKKKATIGDLLKTGTVVGLGAGAAGAIGGGLLGAGIGSI